MGDQLLHIRGVGADVHELVFSPTHTVRQLREHLSVLVHAPASRISLRHGHFVLEESGLEKTLQDLKLEGPGPILLHYIVLTEGSGFIKASASKGEWYWREKGLQRRVMKVGLENLILPEDAKSVMIMRAHFRAVFAGGVEGSTREAEEGESYDSQQVWKMVQTGRVFMMVGGAEVGAVALDKGAKRKIEGPNRIWEKHQRQFRSGDFVEVWISAPPTEQLSTLEHECSVILEYHWSVQEGLYDGPPVAFSRGQSRVEVKSQNGFCAHFTDSNGEICRSVDVAAEQAFICCRQASTCEVDQQQGRVVLLGGFHSEDGQVASTGVVVQAPPGTDLGLPPSGGGIRLEALPLDPPLEEPFQVDVDASAVLTPHWGNLCIEEGYGLTSDRHRSSAVVQVPNWAQATCTLHRGRMAQSGRAVSDAAAEKSSHTDPNLRIFNAQDRNDFRAYHLLTPRLGTFEPEVTVMGQCLRRPPEDLTGTYLKVASMAAQDIPYFMICGESRLKVACEVVCDLYFHNYSFDAGLSTGSAQAVEVSAGETVTCHRYAMGHYLSERPWSLVLAGGFVTTGAPLAKPSHPSIAFTAPPSVIVGGQDCGVPSHGGCVVMRPRQPKKLVGTMLAKEKRPQFTCTGSTRAFITAAWAFRVHFCRDVDLSSSTRHVDVPGGSVLEVCHMAAETYQLSALGRVVSFIRGFVADASMSEEQPCVRLHAEGGDVKDIGLPEPEGSLGLELLYDPTVHISQDCFKEVIEPLRGPESTWEQDKEIKVRHYDTFDDSIRDKVPPYPIGFA
mmetsp:Transcript_58764/g.131429  ORF Transcript_58764/g.131429 Transcript_58764/m.131429 type:complete len:785 (-) Transcript_58764:61-2415(-)